MQVKVNLTTSHYGHFQFHLCAKDDISSHLDESCYEKHVLEILSSANKFVWMEQNGWIEAKSRGANFYEEDEEDEGDLKQLKKPNNNCAVTTSTTKRPTKKTKATTTPTTAAPTTSKVTKSPRTTVKPRSTTTTVTTTTQSSTKGTTTTKTPGEKPVNDRITKYYITTATSYPPDAPAEHIFGVKLPKGNSNFRNMRILLCSGLKLLSNFKVSKAARRYCVLPTLLVSEKLISEMRTLANKLFRLR